MGLIRKGFISLEQDGHPDFRPDAFSEPCQTSKMKQAVNYFRKRLYLWRLMGFSEYSYAEKNNCFENSTGFLFKLTKQGSIKTVLLAISGTIFNRYTSEIV